MRRRVGRAGRWVGGDGWPRARPCPHTDRPRSCPTVMDVSFLEPVFAAPGPYATVCADVTHTSENADTELELRVRAISERLTEQGAPEAVVEAVRGRLLEGNEGGAAGRLRGRAVVAASDGSVVLDEPLVDAPLREVAEWSPQPDLLPVLRQLPGRVPHIVVLIDRVGADITYLGAPGQVEDEKTVEGETFHIRKVKVGGWAHDHWQNSAENQWEANAARVAEQIGSHPPAPPPAVRPAPRGRPGPHQPPRPPRRPREAPPRHQGRGRPGRRRRPRAD